MNIRKVWMAILIVLSLGLLMSAASAQTVTIADGSADAGATTTVTITADDVTDLANFDITVTYNPAVVIVTGAANDAAFGSATNNLEDAASGSVRLASINTGAGQTGDGILISTLTLEAVGTSGQTSPLALTIDELKNSTGVTIAATTDDGLFAVTGEAPPVSIVSISDGSAAAGAATTVTITADDVIDLANFDITVTYNPAVVIVTGAANGAAFGSATNNLEDAASGSVRLASINTGAGQTGDGILISTLTLEAVGTSGQTSPLTLTITQLKTSTGGDITATTDNGLFAVGAAAADTTPPVANAGQDQTVDVLTVVNFDGSGSSDNFGIVSYEWNFGDGTVPAMGETTNHTYPMVGLYTVTLTVCDAAGNKDTDVATVTVNAEEDSKTLSNETSFTIESGNVTVTGNFSVNVSETVTVQAVGNVTAHVPNATTVGLGAGYELISGAIVNVSDDIHEALNRSNGTVTIELCVSDSILSAMGLTRSNVQIYVYNDSAGEWIGLTTTRVGTTDCHTADISGYLSEVTVGIGSKSAPTPYHRTGGGGGGDGTYPPATPTPTVTATAAPTAPPGATPRVTPVATPVEMVETPPAEVEVETPAPTPKTGVPGFTSVFAIAGLLAALYLVLQRRE